MNANEEIATACVTPGLANNQASSEYGLYLFVVQHNVKLLF